MSKSGIIYCDAVCNPLIVPCKCELRNCWAKGMLKRFKSLTAKVSTDEYGQGELSEYFWKPERLDDLWKFKKSRTIFMCSLSDIAYENTDNQMHTTYEDHVEKIFNTVAAINESRKADYGDPHNFLFLTKWPERLFNILNGSGIIKGFDLFNIFIGTTITGLRPDLDRARLKVLKKFKKAGFKTWVSGEPLIDSVPYLRGHLPYIDQVIVGGESGSKARPMHPDWAREIRDMCEAAGVPFFFKQWGEWFPRSQWEHNPDLILPDDQYAYCVKYDPKLYHFDDKEVMHRVGLKKAGRDLDGQEYNQLAWRK